MRAEDKERLARRQRMLARERGEPLPQPPAQAAEAFVKEWNHVPDDPGDAQRSWKK